MKKIFISISTLVISLVSAQNKNESLKREFEKQRSEDIQKFETYAAKKYGVSRNLETLKEIEEVLIKS